jgi:hypothetical protein
MVISGSILAVQCEEAVALTSGGPVVRRWLAFGLLVPLLIAGCIEGAAPGGDGWFRNESAEPITITIAQPNAGFFGGTSTTVHEIPPWHKGWCYAAGLGLGPGPGEMTISVTGGALPSPASTTIPTPLVLPSHVGVLVDASGVVHFTTAAPKQDTGNCGMYRELFPTSSP